MYILKVKCNHDNRARCVLVSRVRVACLYNIPSIVYYSVL